MKVFISWSGERSKALASTLKDYLPLVVQAVDPWFSPDDIDKGSRWLGDLTAQLQKQSVAIVCITPESVNSPWLLFEVGALSKTLEVSWVCPVLFGIEPAEVKGPLTQFQATRLNKEDVRKLLGTLNKRTDSPLGDPQIDRLHDALWPQFVQKIQEIPTVIETPVTAHRSQHDMLAELLERVRGLERRILDPTPTRIRPETLEFFAKKLQDDIRASSSDGPKPQIQEQLEHFHKLAETVIREIEIDELALEKIPAAAGMQRKIKSDQIDRARNRLNQYLVEINRLGAKFNRPRQ